MADSKATSEHKRAYMKKWNAEHKEYRRAALQQWHEQHPGWKREYNARYQREHAEEIKLQRASVKEQRKNTKRRWYASHRDEQCAYARRYNMEHPETALRNYRNFMREPSNRMRILISDAKSRAKKSGKAFDGLPSLRKSMPSSCACCGIPLDYTRKLRRQSPSLDRFDTTKGYTSDNVRVICWRCNSLKRDATLAELETVVAYMRSFSSAVEVDQDAVVKP